jgi:hypothetical protein
MFKKLNKSNILKLLVPERIPGILAYLYDKIARTSITDIFPYKGNNP